jgi:hypothetical protein
MEGLDRSQGWVDHVSVGVKRSPRLVSTVMLTMTTQPTSALPAHLALHWGARPDPRSRSSFCAKQAKKTPETPWHNGATACSACGKDLDANPILVTRMSKAERLLQAAFIEEATMLFESLGAVPNELGIGILGGIYPLVMETKAGKLLVHVYGDCVFTRFVDVELAKQHIDHAFGGGGMNRYSGKWNLHLTEDASVESRMQMLRCHLSPLFTFA